MTRPSPRLAFNAVLALTGLLCAVALWRVVSTLGVPMPLDPNEGWNAYHAASAMRGHGLYPGPEAYLVNNYPPLSFYVVGTLGTLTGDYIVAGRIVSLLSVTWTCVAMSLVTMRLGVSRPVSLLAPLTFLAGLLVFSDYVGMDDPQMLAHAISITGLLVFLPDREGRSRAALAAALFVLAFFIKHNVVALPMAVTVWALLEQRRTAFRLAGFGLLFLAAGLFGFRLTYGVSLLSVVATARTYTIAALFSGLAGWLRWSLMPIVGLGVLMWRLPRHPPVRLGAIYAVIAGAIGIYFLGGAGVDPNVLFDADIALALSAGLLAQHLTGWLRPAAASLLVAPLLFFAATDKDWQDTYLDSTTTQAEAFIARGDIAFMAAQKGPGLCEMLSFCYWAGKPPAVDMFNIGQAFETGSRSDAAIARAVQSKQYAVIQFDPGEPYALGENVYQALMRSYRLHHADDYGTFYVPK